MKIKLRYLFLLCSLISIRTLAQCGLEETIIVCDMTQIDYDNDGQLDGIINLYDEYTAITGNAIQIGTWFDPGFSFALDSTTGDLYLWDLHQSSESPTEYQFLLSNSDCGATTALTLNLILGPFSGIAVPAINENEVNVEACDMGIDPCGSSSYFDLYHALLSIPSAHTNGVWQYIGSSPYFLGIADNRYLQVDIPYQPGVPLVDEETFELTYTVPGLSPCDPDMVTNVKVSVIREVFSGFANSLNVCESEILTGNYSNIDLRDDAFLINEDVEGIWLYQNDDTGQITGFGDSVINLTEVYNDLYASNPRFGCETFEYSYFVESRSSVCEDKTSTVTFTIFEELRPFSQVGDPPEYCCLTQVGNINLYDLLTFTTENGVLYDYPNNACTNWELVSGPSTLGLVSNSGDFCIPDAGYTSMGTINLDNVTNADAGTYVFKYTVLPEYNCGENEFGLEVIHNPPFGCTFASNDLHPCTMETAIVTIILNPTNYAGENTALNVCETNITSPVDLFTLMNTNGTDQIYQGPFGVWTNLDTGQVISNMFDIPNIDGQQTFNFTYDTTDGNGNCPDTATLSLMIVETVNAGNSASISVCNDDQPFQLFDELLGNPDTNGTWTGPNGFMSTANLVTFDPNIFEPGTYTYTVPSNLACPSAQASITITYVQNLTAGNDVITAVCRSDQQLDLSTVLSGANLGGDFIDSNGTGALSGSVLDVSMLSLGTYYFQYQIQTPGCSISSAIIEIMVMEGDAPDANDQSFCVTDLPTIANLIVTTDLNYNWYESNTASSPLANDHVLINGEDYFVSVIDDEGCESPRTQVVVTLLPITDNGCECEINDGISANDDGVNDELDLCNLTEVFPNFELRVFNRYGTLVFKGNHNTPAFNGESNVSPSLGTQLPSGTYFFVFEPNEMSNPPFQGSFYLSR